MFYEYFDIPIAHQQTARFRRNRITGALFVFQLNCRPAGNAWSGPGYGWGQWTRCTPRAARQSADQIASASTAAT